MNRIVLSALAAALLGGLAQAQLDPAFHASQRDNIDVGSSNYGDVWGDGNVALLARFGQNMVDIVDVSNPDNISIVATYTSQNPNTGASDQDVKAGTVPLAPGTPLMFVSCEGGGDDGVEIVDISNPASPQRLTRIDAEPGPYEFIHNTSYRDDGWLVLCDSGNPSVAIIDLRSYDPSSPPATITSWTYEITGLSFFVHDITITDNRLYISGWDDMLVYDVSNLGSSAPSFLGQVRGISSHAVWPSEDEVYVVTTEERTAGAIRLYEIVDNGGSVDLLARDSFVSPLGGTGDTFSAHNVVIKGNRVYVSNYSAGVLVLQIDRTTKTWETVASFDTSTVSSDSGFAGCWGVYPFMGEDRVLVSDIGEGIFTLDFSALEIVWPVARPLTVLPSLPTSISVEVNELARTTLSVNLMTSVDGGAFTQTAMTNSGGNTWTGDLPAMSCGSKVDYYVQAVATDLEGFSSPAAAPAAVHTAYVGDGLTTVFSDTFQSNLGWTVTNAGGPSFPFARGNPVEDGAQPETGDPDSAGNNCYMTGLDGGGFAGDADLDGGTTRLVSPTLDFSSGDGLISYKRWMFCNDGDAVERDEFIVEVSNNNGASYATVETIELKAGGWIENVFRISDHVSPTANVVVRFTVADDPNDSITEGGVDTFVASLLDCTPGPSAMASTYNGSGINPTCFSTTDLPVLGTDFDLDVASAGVTVTFLLGYTMQSMGPIIGPGELLVDVTSAQIAFEAKFATGATTTHTVSIPANPAFLGRMGYFQGGTWTGGVASLCNGIMGTIGF